MRTTSMRITCVFSPLCPLNDLSCEIAHGPQRLLTFGSPDYDAEITHLGRVLATVEDRGFQGKTKIGLMKTGKILSSHPQGVARA